MLKPFGDDAKGECCHHFPDRARSRASPESPVASGPAGQPNGADAPAGAQSLSRMGAAHGEALTGLPAAVGMVVIGGLLQSFQEWRPHELYRERLAPGGHRVRRERYTRVDEARSRRACPFCSSAAGSFWVVPSHLKRWRRNQPSTRNAAHHQERKCARHCPSVWHGPRVR